MEYDSELSSRPNPSSSRNQPTHIISFEDMENGVHLVACSNRFKVKQVGYEACPSEGDTTPATHDALINSGRADSRGCVKDNSTPNMDGCFLVQRSNGGSR